MPREVMSIVGVKQYGVSRHGMWRFLLCWGELGVAGLRRFYFLGGSG